MKLLVVQGAGAGMEGHKDADSAIEGVEALLDDTFAQVNQDSSVVSDICQSA